LTPRRRPVATYLERLRQFPSLTLAKGRPRDRDPADTVATTWQVSVERVRPTPGASELLEVCAFLGPEEIPRELFGQPLDPFPDELAVLGDDPFALDEAFAALRRYALVKADVQYLIVHRLMQQVIRDRLDRSGAASRAAVAVRLLAEAFPGGGFNDPGVWPLCAQLLPHAVAAAGHADHYEVEAAATSTLLDRAESYLHGRARYAEAHPLAERALTLAEATFGPDDEIVAARLGSLANVLPTRATSTAPAPCTSAPWRSARRVWAPTTPTRCAAGRTLRWWWRRWTSSSNRLFGLAAPSVLG
jgi:hypothetical protein